MFILANILVLVTFLGIIIKNIPLYVQLLKKGVGVFSAQTAFFCKSNSVAQNRLDPAETNRIRGHYENNFTLHA